MTTIVRATGLKKSYGGLHVLKGIDLEVQRGEVVFVIGASGSGKSTLLRCLNLLEIPEAGEVWLESERLWQGGLHADILRKDEERINELRSRIGFVFQHFNLFPHMTVRQNVMEGPVTVKKTPKERAASLADEMLDRVGLLDKADTYPTYLSGGQQQRVAIARALAMEPKLLLFDEPTSALDPELVSEVLHVIADLAAGGATMLIVSHEMGFAYEAADRVVFLHEGVIVEEGAAREVLRNPKSERLQGFLARFHYSADLSK